MKEFIDKLISKLEEQKGTESDYSSIEGKKLVRHWNNCVDVCKEIVNELAEEYKVKDCSECSRRKWYQIGYSDAEKKLLDK